MPAIPVNNREDAGTIKPSKPGKATSGKSLPLDDSAIVRLHITPFTPALLNVYLAPSILPLAQNISYHTIETFPEKGFGYLELPAMEATKLKKKLNGSTLKGSKVKIEEAKPEKRKATEDDQSDEKAAKRAKKDRKKKDRAVLEGVELPDDRKIKRGWTEPPGKSRKEKKDKDKRDKRDAKDKKPKQKESKYTKEPELLFKAKLTPVAATEVAQKEKSKGKKEKKSKKSNSKKDVTVHEFENNTKQPSFLKTAQVAAEPKPAVEYINGTGWVDEDGNVVEAETGKARNRRVLELVDTPPAVSVSSSKRKNAATAELESGEKPGLRSAKKEKKVKKQASPPPSSSESDLEESSVVSSSSESEDSDLENGSESEAEASTSSPAAAEGTPEIALTPSSPTTAKAEVHPLEALFKRPKPSAITLPSNDLTSTPAKGLAPINTSFNFFDDDGAMDVDADGSGNPPVTPFTERDLEWRGLRSAAPTPDTAAIGRRFSFSWRKGSQEVDDDDDDVEAGKQLNINTKANSSVAHLPDLAEEDEEDEQDEAKNDSDEEAHMSPTSAKRERQATSKDEDGEKEESEFAKWFWENRGDNNRAWRKRRRESLKARRLRDNKKLRRSG